METINLVELVADDQAFDQDCKFGNHVEGHAVYCHSANENAPRKCQQSWATGGRIRDHECPFFAPNPSKQ